MRPSPRHYLLAIMALAGVFILSGCATQPEAAIRVDEPVEKADPGVQREVEPVKKVSPRLQRERVMQAIWRGQPYHSLLENLGPPRFIMAHPGLRSGGGEIVLYGVRDVGSNCIDAFTIVVLGGSHDRIVADYFCR